MDVKANSLYQEMQAMIAQTRLDVNPQPQVELNTSKSDFSQLLSNAIEKVNDMQLESKDMHYHPLGVSPLQSERRRPSQH